jgi:PTH1 family peptidyl-tRNA hydrolase
MLLLVGLGNPGPDYAGHRHNIGFVALDAICARHRFAPARKKFRGLIAEGEIGGLKVLALKPQTYMNESGQSVGEAARFHKIAPADVIVVHDEIALAVGKLRVKTGGGNAGHNGLRSVDAHIGPGYRRLRIGVGHPGDPERVKDFVLQDFTKSERPYFETLVAAIAEAAPLLVAGEDAAFMSKVQHAVNPRPPKPPRAATAGGEPRS